MNVGAAVPEGRSQKALNACREICLSDVYINPANKYSKYNLNVL